MDIAFRLASAYPRFPLAEGSPLSVHLAGHHQPYEGSKERYTWANGGHDEEHSEECNMLHLAM
jgi:hypothetical protein